MKTRFNLILTSTILLAIVTTSYAQSLFDRDVFTNDIPNVVEFKYKPESRVWWARVAQCQLRYRLEKIKENGLYKINPKEAASLEQKIIEALNISIQNNSNIVIFPELVLAFEEPIRNKIIESLRQKAKRHDLIIVCGSFYNSERKNSSVIITPDGELYGDKIRPSRIETNPLNGFGMKTGENVAYLKTKYGNFIVVTCVDLISDDIQYIIRKMSNLGMLDMCININYNPSSWEFMREASSIVKRHPLFFTITNVDNPEDTTIDTGKAYGHTSVFTSFFKENVEYLVNDKPSPFTICQGQETSKKCERHPAYEMLIANIPPGKEGILIYDLNLRLIRTPSETNAPDQGYPPIRNVQTILFPEKK